MDLETYWTLLPNKAELENLSVDEARAVFRLLMVAALSDREVSSGERVGLAQTLASLPFFGIESHLIFETTEGIRVLAEIYDRIEDDFASLMAEIADAIQDTKKRTLALQLVARFVQTDEFSDDEYDFCLTVAQALGIEEDAAVSAIEEAWALAEA